MDAVQPELALLRRQAKKSIRTIIINYYEISPLHSPLDLWFPALLLLWLRHSSKIELRIFRTGKRRGQSNRKMDDNAHQRKQPQAEKFSACKMLTFQFES